MLTDGMGECKGATFKISL